MRHLVFIACCLGFLGACREKQEHLPPRKMEEVLLDVQLAEVYSTLVPKDTTRHEAGGRNTDSLAAWYRDIFGHHRISREQFDRSVEWYRKHPEELDSVYTHVLIRLEQMERPAAGAGLRR